jgi:hypothetical protein
MSDFNSDPYPPRWVLMLLAVGAVLLVGLILFAAFPSKGAAAESAPCIDTEMREQVRSLMLAGIDEALKRHARRMFDVWMKDPSDQPRRASAGVNTAISAYVRSRASAQRWNPPACP